MSTTAQEIKLKKFSFERMKPSDIVMVVGKRAAGKTTLLCDIWNQFQNDFRSVLIVDPVYEYQQIYPRDRPNVRAEINYSNDLISSTLTAQKLAIQEGNPNYQCFILDGCMFDTQFQKSSEMKEIFYNGKMYRTMLLLSLSYIMGLDVGLRNNIDWVFLYKDNVPANKRRMYDYFGGLFPTYETFSKIFDDETGDYKCLVIHLASQSVKVEDSVFWYKTGLHDEVSSEEAEPSSGTTGDESHEITSYFTMFRRFFGW